MKLGRLLGQKTFLSDEAFSLLTCLDDIKFVSLSFFTLIETVGLKIWAKPPLKNVISPPLVGVRRRLRNAFP